MFVILAKIFRFLRWRWARPLGKATVALLILVFAVVGVGIVQAGAWALSATRWTDRDERAYEEFVQALGESRHGNLNRFIHDPQANPLYGEDDKKFNLSPDCADLPYLLRAYVAYKLRLPFGWTSEISTRGGDERYSRGNRPAGERDLDGCDTPQRLFGAVTLVNSGYYRMAPEIQDSDTYTVKVGRDSIKPGTIYYDPNGHVAVVYQVTDDGRVRMIDAHPDRSISRPWFGAKFALGNAQSGGGFRRWRPQWYSAEGRVNRLSNHNLPDFSGTDQYQRGFSFNGMGGLSYYDYVRVRLSNRGDRIRPLEDFRNMLADVFEDVRYRAEAVNICIQAGIHRKPHPGALPSNIYGTDGEWEQYSTPSRDARLKVAFRDLFLRTVGWIRMAETGDPRLVYDGGPQRLAQELLAIYDGLNPGMRVNYINSAGRAVGLTFQDVVQRLFDLSFDPYHSVELRWGARGEELATAGDDATKRRFYDLERRLRHQLERLYNVPTGLSLGPERPVNVDIRTWLTAYLAGQARPEAELAAPDAGSPVILAQAPAAAPLPAAEPTPRPPVDPPTSGPAPSPAPARANLPPMAGPAAVAEPPAPPPSPAAAVLARTDPGRPARPRPPARSGGRTRAGPPAWRFAEAVFSSIDDLGVSLLEHSTLNPVHASAN
ncbi:MAG: hypothetical protein GX442_16260 [Candidatus Riflebacteria bacterium]|nr:hypothetical protein [Candidatus Riflebacteria bacterium]